MRHKYSSQLIRCLRDTAVNWISKDCLNGFAVVDENYTGCIEGDHWCLHGLYNASQRKFVNSTNRRLTHLVDVRYEAP